MADRSTRGRMGRLDQLRGLLASGDPTTLPALADTLGVSARTVARDIALLRDGGLPVEGDRGRGGGLRLPRGFRTGRVHFDHAEAIDLLLSLAIAERFGSPLFLQHLGAIRRKVATAFADRHADRIGELRRRILVGTGASDVVRTTWKPPTRQRVASVAEAFFEQRRIEIDYAGGQDGPQTTRTVEPHYLLCNPPVWYLIAFDRLRSAPRSFRLDRVRAVRPTDERFRLMPRDRLVDAAGIEADGL